jgi:hypothetical protein
MSLLYDPNPTFSAIRRTIELVGEGIHWNGG